MVDSGGIEPSADIRKAAHQLREMYIALLLEGFTEAQALRMIGYAMSGGSNGGE